MSSSLVLAAPSIHYIYLFIYLFYLFIPYILDISIYIYLFYLIMNMNTDLHEFLASSGCPLYQSLPGPVPSEIGFKEIVTIPYSKLNLYSDHSVHLDNQWRKVCNLKYKIRNIFSKESI